MPPGGGRRCYLGRERVKGPALAQQQHRQPSPCVPASLGRCEWGSSPRRDCQQCGCVYVVTRAHDDALLEAFGVAPVSRIVCRKELWNLRVGVSLSIYHHRYIERKVCTCVCVCVCV
jgi:hypothetical protein